MSERLSGKTVDELRKLARQQGVRGYSKMRKSELIQALQNGTKTAKSDAGKKRHPTAASVPAMKKPAAPDTVRPASVADETLPAQTGSPEQLIESSKYAVTIPGRAPVEPRFPADLGENLDHMPAPVEPVICLLPQKPGVMHAYWSLIPPLPAVMTDLRLRLGRLSDEGVEIVEEIRLSSERGHWYFHVPESASSGDYYLQLGSYRDGRFVTAIRRGIARVPRLYASQAVDRRWWIDDERFREMYLRSGGELRRGRLTWAGAAGSPGGAGDSTVFARPSPSGHR